ncbi:phosphoadenylyl-sulfate reductase [Oceanobacter mangrovi]|uniref:phosphoadenylyl-sulfate reductase n=1 Tax=Oceanobacter mangrovi TaxID=2862510 RepID=UPI001C8E54AC|nr:phosphoadenylyl-sulfate reductase [Oceanobacter mangrovi]
MTDFAQLNQEYANKRPKDLIRYALEQHDAIAVSFSGAEDVVLIDMAVKIKKDVEVFTLDTGRLHPETYEFIEQVRKHYGIKIHIQSPDKEKLQAFTSEKGLFSFFEDGHKECCGVRKIEPLKNKLATLDGWITGQRRDQSPGTRSNIEMVEIDGFPGRNGAGSLVKYNPLTHWSSQDVWDYIKMFDVPYNKLHAQGFKSIGCQPCTRPTLPGQHEREGRWWWEEETHKECGLHGGNIISKG